VLAKAGNLVGKALLAAGGGWILAAGRVEDRRRWGLELLQVVLWMDFIWKCR
jgi:hypothetical protein